MLSLKASAKTAADPYTVTTESDSIHLRPRPPHTQNTTRLKSNDTEAGQTEVMWEVGSVSDSEDGKDDEQGGSDKRRGSAQPGARGEQRGLLNDDDD